MTIICIRHGETTWNRAELMQGWAPTLLTELGREQATQVGARLVDEYDIDRILSLDLYRTKENPIDCRETLLTQVRYTERFFTIHPFLTSDTNLQTPAGTLNHMEYDELQQIYAQDEYYWGTEPNELVKRAVEHAPDRDNLTAIDVGAGEGRDSVYLAEQNIDVTAVDIAPNGLEKAEQLADERGVDIEVTQADINTLELASPVDIFYSIGTIQYLRPENRADTFEHFKIKTISGGIHALFAFVDRDTIPPAPDWGENEYYYDETELHTYYEDWECLYTEDLVFDDDSGGEPHQHAAVEVLYRKPSSNQ